MNIQAAPQLISIIIPAYNCEKYISMTVESVINQTYNNIEIIIINDCSVDNTEQIIFSYLQKDHRIRYLKNEHNSGVAFSRNKGIDFARGEWIAFVDSDDVWSLEKLERQLNLATQKMASFIFTAASFIDQRGKKSNYIFNVPIQINYKQLLKQNVISCSSVLVKKELIENIKMKHDELHEDYILWLTLLRSGIIAYGLNEPLLKYRVLSNSKSGNKMKSAKMTFKVYKLMGLNWFQAVYYFSFYVYRSLIKYKKIKS